MEVEHSTYSIELMGTQVQPNQTRIHKTIQSNAVSFKSRKANVLSQKVIINCPYQQSITGTALTRRQPL